MVLLVANPLVQLAMSSLSDPDTGEWTLHNYVVAFGRARYLDALAKSLLLALASALLAALFAVPLAWGVARTRMVGRRLVHAGVVCTFLVPPFIGAIAWILLAGPNAGWLNRIWRALTGAAAGPFNIFSFTGLAFVIALYAYPLIYVFVRNALELVPSDVEDAAQIHGAGAARVALRITLPMVAPAIIGSTILVFLEAVALYGAPSLIGIPAGINVVSTQLAEFFEAPIRLEVAAAFSIPLVVFTAVLIWLQRVVLGRRGFASVTGKAATRRRISLGAGDYLLSAYAAAVIGLSFVLPLCVMLVTAFSRSWGRPPTLDNLSLVNFQRILFEDVTIRGSIWNTLSYSLLAATACTVLGLSTAYVTQHRLLPGAGALSLLALSPFAIPGVVIAISFYTAYAGPPASLYGTGLLIVLAFVTRFLPVAVTTASAGLRSLNAELEEAALILGGGRLRTLGRIVVPLLRRTLLGAWILIFIIATRELSTAVFLSGPGSRVISVLTLDLSEQGRYEQLAALGLLVILATGVVVALASLASGRDVLQGAS